MGLVDPYELTYISASYNAQGSYIITYKVTLYNYPSTTTVVDTYETL